MFEFETGFKDIELDFDLSDFLLCNPDGKPIGDHAEPQGRILQPRIDPETLFRGCFFENAEEFAKQIDLTGKTRTFAWINGSFIFGDIVEALMRERGVYIKNLYLCSLSLSRENIDSLKNCMLIGKIEHVVIVLSAYFFSHERNALVPYLYKELAYDFGDKIQIVFGNFHGKIITMETHRGNTITIHGSANLRSSRSIEQIMVELDPELHRFNAEIMDHLAERFGVVNLREYKRLKEAESWPVVLEAVDAAAEDADTSPTPRGDDTPR